MLLPFRCDQKKMKKKNRERKRKMVVLKKQITNITFNHSHSSWSDLNQSYPSNGLDIFKTPATKKASHYIVSSDSFSKTSSYEITIIPIYLQSSSITNAGKRLVLIMGIVGIWYKTPFEPVHFFRRKTLR